MHLLFLCESSYVWRQSCERPHWGLPSPGGIRTGQHGAMASGPTLLTPAGGATVLSLRSPATPVLHGEKLGDECGVTGRNI